METVFCYTTMKAATLVAALTLTILMIPNCTEGIVYFQRLLKGPATVSSLIFLRTYLFN